MCSGSSSLAPRCATISGRVTALSVGERRTGQRGIGADVCDSPAVPPRYDVVLFDLDGTLTDSAPGILNGIRLALADQGIEPPEEEVLRTFLGPPLVDTFGGAFGMDDDAVLRAIARYREHYHQVGLYENAVYPGIPEVLAAVAESGATLAVSTSKPTYSATLILEHFDLAGHFAFIGGASLDDTRRHKAEVIAPTLAALAEQGVSTDGRRVIMIGDREHDVRGARAHGLDCIGVLWGYGDADELTGAGAVDLAASPDALLELLT